MQVSHSGKRTLLSLLSSALAHHSPQTTAASVSQKVLLRDVPIFITPDRIHKRVRVPDIWASARKAAEERSSGRCEICGGYASTWDVHHIIYRHEAVCYLDHDPHDPRLLAAVCKAPCHGYADSAAHPPSWFLYTLGRGVYLNTRVRQCFGSINYFVEEHFLDKQIAHTEIDVRGHRHIQLPVGIFGPDQIRRPKACFDAAMKTGDATNILSAFARLRKVDPATATAPSTVAAALSLIQPGEQLRGSFHYQMVYAAGALFESSQAMEHAQTLATHAALSMEHFASVGDDDGVYLTQSSYDFFAAINDVPPGNAHSISRQVQEPLESIEDASLYYNYRQYHRGLCEQAIARSSWDEAHEEAQRYLGCLDVSMMPERTHAYLLLAKALAGRFCENGEIGDAALALMAYSASWLRVLYKYEAEMGGEVAISYAEFLAMVGRSDLGQQVLSYFIRNGERRFAGGLNGRSLEYARQLHCHAKGIENTSSLSIWSEIQQYLDDLFADCR